MAEQENKTYFQQQNIEFSFDRIAIKGLGGMAHGLFASLLIGTVLATIGTIIFRATGDPTNALGLFFNNNNAAAIAAGDQTLAMSGINYFTTLAQGAAMALAIAYNMQCPPYVLFSLATVGIAANSLGGGGGPLAVYVVSLIAIFCGKLVSKRTPIDLIVTPSVTIIVGIIAARIIAPPIGKIATALGQLIMWATEQQPFLMGILVSAIVGIVLTLPISSAAICAALGLVGLAGGAATIGCCCHMVGFAACSYRENKAGGLAAIGLGTSMLLVPNLLKKPVLWVPPVIASIICGPIGTVIFHMTQNQVPVSSGMGTCGLVGPIGVIFGWLNPGTAAVEAGYSAISPTAFDWLGLLLCCIILPAVISWFVSEFMRKKGIIQEGDYKLI